MTHSDAIAATNALKDWMKSQGLKPHEGVYIAERFIANMMLANMQFGKDLEEKLEASNDRIRKIVAIKLMSPR